MKKMYQVFEVSVCFTSYAIDYVLIGAKDKDDLLAHIDDWYDDEEFFSLRPGEDAETLMNLIKTNEHVVKAIDNLYTDVPYTVLNRFSYYE